MSQTFSDSLFSIILQAVLCMTVVPIHVVLLSTVLCRCDDNNTNGLFGIAAKRWFNTVNSIQ